MNIDYGIKNDWLVWMKDVHIPEVVETGLIVDCKIWKVLSNEDTGFTYSVQYQFNNMSDYNVYASQHAPELKKKHVDRYGDQALAFRTILEFEHHHG